MGKQAKWGSGQSGDAGEVGMWAKWGVGTRAKGGHGQSGDASKVGTLLSHFGPLGHALDIVGHGVPFCSVFSTLLANKRSKMGHFCPILDSGLQTKRDR